MKIRKEQKTKKKKKKSNSKSKSKNQSHQIPIDNEITNHTDINTKAENDKIETEITISNETFNLSEEEKKCLIENIIGELESEKTELKNYNFKLEDTNKDKEIKKN